MTIDFHNGPLMTYLAAAVFGFFGHRPVAMCVLVALCSVLGLWVTYVLGSRLYSPAVGRVATILSAAGPSYVLWGRGFWPPALLLLLAPLCVLTLWTALRTHRPLAYATLGLLLGLGIQLHLPMVALLGVTLVATCLFASGSPLTGPLLIGLGALLGYAPVLVHDLAHGFENLRVLASIPWTHRLPSDEPWVRRVARAAWYLENVVSGQNLWRSTLSLERAGYYPRGLDWLQGVVFSALLAGSFLLLGNRVLRARGDASAQHGARGDALLLTLVLPPLGYLLLSRNQVYRHYFLFLAPLLTLITARGIVMGHELLRGRCRTRALRGGVVAVAAAGIAVNLTTLGYALAFVEGGGGEFEWGTVLADKEHAVDAVVNHASDGYVVHLAEVKETLPYVFLFTVRDPAVVADGPPNHAIALRRPGGTGRAAYRLVERPETLTSQCGKHEHQLLAVRNTLVCWAPSP